MFASSGQQSGGGTKASRSNRSRSDHEEIEYCVSVSTRPKQKTKPPENLVLFVDPIRIWNQNQTKIFLKKRVKNNFLCKDLWALRSNVVPSRVQGFSKRTRRVRLFCFVSSSNSISHRKLYTRISFVSQKKVSSFSVVKVKVALMTSPNKNIQTESNSSIPDASMNLCISPFVHIVVLVDHSIHYVDWLVDSAKFISRKMR